MTHSLPSDRQDVHETARDISWRVERQRWNAGTDPLLSPSSSPVDALLQNHGHLPIDHQLATFLLGRVLSSHQDQGFLELFARNGHLPPDVAGDGPFILSTGSVLSLVSVAVEQHWPELPGYIRCDIVDIQNDFRNQTLASIPSLLEQRVQLAPQHLGTLLLLSYTWCFSHDLVALAYRWNNVALALGQDMLDDDIHIHKCVSSD